MNYFNRILLFNHDFSKVLLKINNNTFNMIEYISNELDIINKLQENFKFSDIQKIGNYYIESKQINLFRARIIEDNKNFDLNYKWIDINEVENICNSMEIIFALNKSLAIPKQKIGIYGGAFNPLTYLHLLTMERAIEEKQLDYCIIEPVGDNYNKQELLKSKYRIEMLKLGIENNDKLKIGDFEYKKLIQPNTIETLEYYKNKFGWCEIYFICGSDNLKNMCGEHAWLNYNKILENFNVICVQRDNDNVYQDIILKNEVLIKNKNHIHVIHENVINNISSTAVRNLIKANMSIKYLVPEKIEKYIKDNKLYI